MDVDLVGMGHDTSTFLIIISHIRWRSMDVFLWMMLVKLEQWVLFDMMQNFTLAFALASYCRCNAKLSCHWGNKKQAMMYQDLLLNLNPLITIIMTLILFPMKISLKNHRLFYFDLCLIWIGKYVGLDYFTNLLINLKVLLPQGGRFGDWNGH